MSCFAELPPAFESLVTEALLMLLPIPNRSSSSSSSRNGVATAFLEGFCFTVPKRSSPWSSKMEGAGSFFGALAGTSAGAFVLGLGEGATLRVGAKRSPEPKRSSPSSANAVTGGFLGLTAWVESFSGGVAAAGTERAVGRGAGEFGLGRKGAAAGWGLGATLLLLLELSPKLLSH